MVYFEFYHSVNKQMINENDFWHLTLKPSLPNLALHDILIEKSFIVMMTNGGKSFYFSSSCSSHPMYLFIHRLHLEQQNARAIISFDSD